PHHAAGWRHVEHGIVGDQRSLLAATHEESTLASFGSLPVKHLYGIVAKRFVVVTFYTHYALNLGPRACGTQDLRGRIPLFPDLGVLTVKAIGDDDIRGRSPLVQIGHPFWIESYRVVH